MSRHLHLTSELCRWRTEKGTAMNRNSILTATLLGATAMAALPLTANAAQYDGTRSQREWTDKKPVATTTTTTTTTSTRGTANNQRGGSTPPLTTTNNGGGRTTTVASGHDRDGDDDDYGRKSYNSGRNAPVVSTRSRNDDDDDHGYRGNSRGGRYSEEAAQGRQPYGRPNGVYFRRGHEHGFALRHHHRRWWAWR